METSDEVGHLSIGEVLSLLQSEFPDVTISKIRFLEAQGLIDPERTPSGYRKFYEPDIVRLRWILRQQRDHFLPLKVIKTRLERDEDIDFESPVAVQPNLWTEDSPGSPTGATGDSPTSGPAPEVPWKPKVQARRHPASGLAQQSSAPGTESRSASTAGSVPVADTQEAAQEAASEPATGAGTAAGDASGDTAESADATRDSAAWLAALQESPRPSPPAARPAEPAPLGVGRGVRFGLAEVVEVTGVDAAAIQNMTDFGLVTPTVIGGETTYDASSVAVVRAVAAFLAQGVEPRHLRMFKNAAEREAGFYEQMILPLLKQRNPKARDRAASTLTELAAAGDDLSRALVRQALRSHLGE